MATNQPKSQSHVSGLPPTILIVPKVNIQQDKTQTAPLQECASQSPSTSQGILTSPGIHVPSSQQLVLNLQQAQLSQNANLSLGNNITLTVQPAGQPTRPGISTGAAMPQLGTTQVTLEARKQDFAKHPTKMGAFFKPSTKQPIQVPQRVYKRSVAAIQMQQLKQIEKQAKTGAVTQPVNMQTLVPPKTQPGQFSAILLQPNQLQGSIANSVSITSGSQAAATAGKSSASSPPCNTKSQPVLVQTAMSPKIIVQAAPTGSAHQTGPGKPVIFTGGQRFTIVPSSQGNMLSPTSVGPTTGIPVAAGATRTMTPTVAQLARQQRLQKALAVAQQQQQQQQHQQQQQQQHQQQHLITPNAIHVGQRPLALKQTATSPIQVSHSVVPTHLQAVGTSASTNTLGQIQFTPRIPLAISTQAQQLQQQQIQSLTPGSKITLGQVGAISNVQHRTSTAAPSTNIGMDAVTNTQVSNMIASQQPPLTILPKQFILASGIQVPSTLQGTFNLQPGSTPLSNVQAKIIQTPVQGCSSTQANLQTNIMLQALPKYTQAQLKTGNTAGNQTSAVVVQGSTSPSIVQPHLIQTCGAQATIGLIQVNLSQSQQSLVTVSSLSQPIVRATVQAPIPHAQAEGSMTYRPQLLQLTGLPNQQYLQVVSQPQQPILPMPPSQQVSQPSVSMPVPIAPKIPTPKLGSPHPVLTPIITDGDKTAAKEFMSSIDVALKYKMPYPQAPIPQRKRRHSEIEDGAKEKETKTEEGNKKDEDNIEFTWEDYLEITGSKPAPHTAFKHVEASLQSGVSMGMKVEVQNRQSVYVPYRTYWVASVVSACGSLLLLRYGGYGNDRSADFWMDMATGELHPIGWCARNGRSLRPPDELLNKGHKNWEEYLVSYLTGAKSIPEYVLYIRKVSSPTPVDRIKKGMRVEVQDDLNPRHAWIAIIKETYGGRLRLRYAGIDNNSDDFWLFYLSWRVHPIGWAKEKLVFMKPPAVLRMKIPNNTEAAWNTMYQYALSAALKEASFPKEFFKDQPKIRCHRFRKGMRLEAINPAVPSQICPATVSDWLNDKSFLVTVDTFTEERPMTTFMCNADSGSIFPVSWCEKHGYALTPPKGYDGPHFQWSSYLKRCDAKPAPKELFRIYSRDHEFRPYMKLEAVNPFSPSEVCVATITKVVNRHMWLHFDDSKLMNLVVDSESYDIFPVGWCESNGCVLKAPKKLIARKAKKVAIVWPEKQSRQPTISPISPGRDLYQKIQSLSKDEDSAEGHHDSDWTGKVFFNHKCFSGPYLSKGRIAELPKAVGPGIVVLVLREVLSLLINAAYKPPRVLKELEIENEETAGMNGHLQVMKAKYKGKSYRSMLEICKSSVEMTEYLRTACIKLECCPNLVSLLCVKDDEECPDNCTNLTKTKYTYQYGKKRKFHHIGRASGQTNPVKPLLPPVRRGNKRRKRRRPFVHRKKHILSQEDGEPDANEEDGEMERQEMGRGGGGGGGGGLGGMKKNTMSQTVAHALLQSAKRKKIHPVPPKLILPHRERGTKLKTFAAILTSNRAQKKVEKEKKQLENNPAVNHNKPKTKSFLNNNKSDDRLHLTSNPLQWTTSEVVTFIEKTDCATLARIFEEQEIDGQALLLLTLPTVQECMDLKLGPAIKLCHHIERVKIAFYDQFAK